MSESTAFEQVHKKEFLFITEATVAQSEEFSAPDRRPRVRGSPGEKPPCMLMTSDAYKICGEGNVLLVPFQITPLGGTKAGEPSHPWRIKIVMACLRIILRDESQTVGNNPLALL